MAVSTSVTLFKRGSRAVKGSSKADSTADSEKGAASEAIVPSRSGQTTVAPTPRSGSAAGAGNAAANGAGMTKEAEKALEGAVTKTTDVFTWRNVRYTIKTTDGDDRVLLNDISGYVAPGKLTALMGESGAGTPRL